jgi:hypothetical protein
MPVPKKRKKMGRTTESIRQRRDSAVEQPATDIPVSVQETRSARNLDEAFEIIEQIPPPEIAESSTPSSESQRVGFQWKISLEAVLPGDSEQEPEDRSAPSKRATLMDVGFTVPFFWGWPIFGEMARSYLENFKPYKYLDLF